MSKPDPTRTLQFCGLFIVLRMSADLVALVDAAAVSALLKLFARLAVAFSCASQSDTFRSSAVNCVISSLYQ